MEPADTTLHTRACVGDTVGSSLVESAVALGRTPFVSPTTSDMALMHGIHSLKMGPGESSRSHTADEYVLISEIEEALDIYPRLIMQLNINKD